MPQEAPCQKAARQYLEARDLYRQSIERIGPLDPLDCVGNWLAAAALGRVRAKFGGIGRALTRELGCHFFADCDEVCEKPQNEHAVPLNLIHDRILGITASGKHNTETAHLFPDAPAIEGFISRFVIGVSVTPAQHKRLDKHYKETMPEGWDWLAELADWTWHAPNDEGISRYHQLQAQWVEQPPPAWLSRLMGRYEQLPERAIAYHPLGHCKVCAAKNFVATAEGS